jgi:hypothetical protein
VPRTLIQGIVEIKPMPEHNEVLPNFAEQVAAAALAVAVAAAPPPPVILSWDDCAEQLHRLYREVGA